MNIQYLFWNAEGQPDSIVQDIENMVRAYIEKVMHILLLKLFASYENSCVNWIFSLL